MNGTLKRLLFTRMDENGVNQAILSDSVAIILVSIEIEGIFEVVCQFWPCLYDSYVIFLRFDRFKIAWIIHSPLYS